MKKHGYRKKRPRTDRHADRIWASLGEAGGCGLTTIDAAAASGAALSTAKHLLARWRQEGLVTMHGGIGGQPATWVRYSELGPLAPLCHGPLCGGSGYSDPNANN